MYCKIIENYKYCTVQVHKQNVRSKLDRVYGVLADVFLFETQSNSKQLIIYKILVSINSKLHKWLNFLFG